MPAHAWATVWSSVAKAWPNVLQRTEQPVPWQQRSRTAGLPSHLHRHVSAPVAALLQDLVEVGQQILGEEVLNHAAVVLVAPAAWEMERTVSLGGMLPRVLKAESRASTSPCSACHCPKAQLTLSANC